MRIYGQGTHVNVGRSREQINKLLSVWGVEGIQWTDTNREISFTLRFRWLKDNIPLMTRYTFKMDEEKLKKQSLDGRSKKFSQAKFDKMRNQWSLDIHRLLLIVLKAQFGAIQAGLWSASAAFLPFIEDSSGQVVHEVMESRLSSLPGLHAERLLMSGE